METVHTSSSWQGSHCGGRFQIRECKPRNRSSDYVGRRHCRLKSFSSTTSVGSSTVKARTVCSAQQSGQLRQNARAFTRLPLVTNVPIKTAQCSLIPHRD